MTRLDPHPLRPAPAQPPARRAARIGIRLAAPLAALACAVLAPQAAHAQVEPFIGEIRCFGFNFAPFGWAPLDGRLLPIAQNTALFSLIGIQFGGDGRTTFALPDMRGRSLVNFGQGPGLALNAAVGQAGGAEEVVISREQMPRHAHTVAPLGSTNAATATTPAGKVPGSKATQTLYADPTNTVEMAATSTSRTGQSLPLPIRSPYLAVNCAIALEGIYPPRP